jgi:hypothetical protein
MKVANLDGRDDECDNARDDGYRERESQRARHPRRGLRHHY